MFEKTIKKTGVIFLSLILFMSILMASGTAASNWASVLPNCGRKIIGNVSKVLTNRYRDISVTNGWYSGKHEDLTEIVLFGALKKNKNKGVAEVLFFTSSYKLVQEKRYIATGTNGPYKVSGLGTKDTNMFVTGKNHVKTGFSIMFGFDS